MMMVIIIHNYYYSTCNNKIVFVYIEPFIISRQLLDILCVPMPVLQQVGVLYHLARVTRNIRDTVTAFHRTVTIEREQVCYSLHHHPETIRALYC